MLSLLAGNSSELSKTLAAAGFNDGTSTCWLSTPGWWLSMISPLALSLGRTLYTKEKK